jgi:glucose/arabinose dehydrogenase
MRNDCRLFLRSTILGSAVALAAAILPAAAANAGVPLPPDLELVPVASGLANPVVVTHAGDGSGRLFIVEKAGQIRVVDNGLLVATPFLDITSIVNSTGFEQGLLGLAFDPDYSVNGDFYVYYTRADNATVLAHYNASPPSSNTAGTTGTVLWTQAQPAANHNAGQLAFGPDGDLYMAVGDGGIQGDPNDYGQSLDTWLGKILRISVSGASPYTVPADNPYVGVAGALDEIWQSGLRNPWRFSFDRVTGDLFIGDVGYSTWEEIDMAPAASTGGENWGWRCYEGAHPYNTTGCGPVTDYELPILEYAHSLGRCSVTGGYRYRGISSPGLLGAYLFGDYCTGDVWAGVEDAMSGSWSVVDLAFPNDLSTLTTFGEDESGEVYVAAGSTVYRFHEIGAIFADNFESSSTGAWSSTLP